MKIKQAKRVPILASIVVLSMASIGQAVFADTDENGRKIKTVKVDCAEKTIGKALTKHRSKVLRIIVEGTCHEDVFIDRNRVSLVAATPGVDGVTSLSADGAAVTVSGAQEVVIDGLRLQSAGGGSSSGVFVTRNGEATIENALIENNTNGIWANHGGFFLLRGSDVVNNRDYGILLTDAGHARIQDSLIEIDNADRGSSAAIGAFRGITLRLRGNNTIGNKAADGLSLSLFHSVDFRQDGGHTKFNGSMEFGNLTNASLRDPEIVGGIDVFGGARVEIRNSPDPGSGDELTGGADINVNSNSRLAFTRSVTVANVGSIFVNEFSSLSLGNDVSVTAAGPMNVNGSRFSMGAGSSISVDKDEDKVLSIEDFSVMFAGDFTRISANMEFGGSIAKVNLFGSNVQYIGNINFSSRSTLDFGSNAFVFGEINCGGGEVNFTGLFFVSGGLNDCVVFP